MPHKTDTEMDTTATSQLPPPLILVGFSGIGKSRVGRCLARLTGWTFVDTDEHLEAQYHSTISEMFATCGIDKFRKREKALLIPLTLRRQCIIATGGGLPCHDDNMALLLSRGTVIYLHSDTATMVERLELCQASRPLVAGKSRAELQAYVAETLPQRTPYYEQAHHHIDVSGMLTPEAEEVIARRIASTLHLPLLPSSL